MRSMTEGEEARCYISLERKQVVDLNTVIPALSRDPASSSVRKAAGPRLKAGVTVPIRVLHLLPLPLGNTFLVAKAIAHAAPAT